MKNCYCPVHDIIIECYSVNYLNMSFISCKDCNSLACAFSPSFIPVEKWKCYQKKFENHV